MNGIGYAAIALFAIGWLAAIVSWFYGAYHVAMWSFGRGTGAHGAEAIKGGAAFLACWLFAVFNGLIGGWFGGWQPGSGF
jgi:hypothetical protein